MQKGANVADEPNNTTPDGVGLPDDLRELLARAEREDSDVPVYDPDAEDAGVVGLEVVKRILGAQVIEEVTVTQEGR